MGCIGFMAAHPYSVRICTNVWPDMVAVAGASQETMNRGMSVIAALDITAGIRIHRGDRSLTFEYWHTRQASVYSRAFLHPTASLVVTMAATMAVASYVMSGFSRTRRQKSANVEPSDF